MRVDWVHPSWRDLVIESLAARPDEARRRFLARCGVDGAAVALSSAAAPRASASGRCCARTPTGTRSATACTRLCHELDEAEAVQLLGVLDDAGDDAEVLRAGAARAGPAAAGRGKAISVDALGAWARVAAKLDPRPEPPAVAMTWLELEPAARARDAGGARALRGLAAAGRAAARARPRAARGARASRSATRAVLEAFADQRAARRAACSSASCGSSRSARLARARRRRCAGRALSESLALREAAAAAAARRRRRRRDGFPVERVLRDLVDARRAARRTLPDGVLGSSAAKSTIARVLVGRGLALHVVLQRAGERRRRRVAVAQHDDGAHDRAALVVGRGDHGGLGDRLVGDQRGLDLERADPVAGGDDHVVGAALEVQVAVLVARDAVAGVPRARVRLLAEVVQEERRVAGAGRSTSSPSTTSRSTPGSGRPIEPGPRRLAQRRAGQLAGLGLAVAVADPEPGGLVPGVQDLGVERLAGGDEALEAGSGRSVARLAITRYSVGAMQSTSTRSRAISSSRSCGSKRASCRSAAAPRSQGAMNALRADFDQPAAAVHHTSRRVRAPASARPGGAGR